MSAPKDRAIWRALALACEAMGDGDYVSAEALSGIAAGENFQVGQSIGILAANRRLRAEAEVQQAAVAGIKDWKRWDPPE